jgi:tetratricopeptide (TPR) repeat protein
MVAKRRNSKKDDARPRFDAALSYAREDEEHAERLYQGLTRRGLKVFFDRAYKAELWGKDENYLQQIFGPGSRFVLPLISEAYAKKSWTRFEFEAAKREEVQRNEERVLPIRLDDTYFLGIGQHSLGMDLRRDSFKDIVDTLLEKLGREPDADAPKPLSQSAAPSTKRPVRVTSLLAGRERKALGLLAVSDLPLPRTAFEDLFPELPWRKVFTEARRLGWVRVESGVVEVAPQLKRTLGTDEQEAKGFRKEWVKAIEPHRDHYDIALVAVLHYVALGQSDEALALLLMHASSVRDPFWVGLYELLLRGLASARQFDQLPAEQKVLIINSWGICLVVLRRLEEARDVFDRLLKLSRELSNTWGIGQALVNGGKARALLGDERARVLYRTAAWHARSTKDQVLLGRALGNLAFMYLHRPQRAARFLEESLAAKQAAGDEDGMVAGALASGALAAEQRQFRVAERHFRDAKKRARRLGKVAEQAFAMVSLGHLYLKEERYAGALQAFEEVTQRLDLRIVPFETHVLTLDGQASAHRKMGQLARAERVLRELVGFTREQGEKKPLLQAQHKLALLLGERRKLQEAQALLDKMIRLARRHGMHSWVFEALRSKAELLDEGAVSKRSSLLRRARKLARKAGDSYGWAETSYHLGELYAEQGRFTKAERLLREVERAEERPEAKNAVMLDRLELLWRSRRYRAAEALFAKLQALAERTDDDALYIEAHMRFADSLWRGGRDAQLQALQAYLVALGRDMTASEEMGGRVGMHIFRQLYQLPVRGRAGKIQMLHEETEAWMMSQAELRDHADFRYFLLWPLRLAREIDKLEQQGVKVTESSYVRLSRKVIADAVDKAVKGASPSQEGGE